MGAFLQSVFKVKELFNPDLKIGGVVTTMQVITFAFLILLFQDKQNHLNQQVLEKVQ